MVTVVELKVTYMQLADRPEAKCPTSKHVWFTFKPFFSSHSEEISSWTEESLHFMVKDVKIRIG